MTHPNLPSSNESKTSVKTCVILNVLSFTASIPVWVMARKAAVWSGGSENWDAFYFFLVGGGILIVQIVIALVALVILLRKYKKWIPREKWICAVTLPFPVLSTLLAHAYSSPFYGY